MLFLEKNCLFYSSVGRELIYIILLKVKLKLKGQIIIMLKLSSQYYKIEWANPKKEFSPILSIGIEL